MKIVLSLIFCFSFLFAQIDINKADVKELVSLKGIGAKKASLIVDYRKANGCFNSVEDLMKIKGIGKKILEKNRDNLIITECKK